MLWTTGNQAIRKIQPNGDVSTLVGKNTQGQTTERLVNPNDITMDRDGNLFVTDVGDKSIKKVTPEGKVTTVAGGGNSAVFNYPRGICIDDSGNLFVTEYYTGEIKKVDTSYNVTTICKAGTLKYPYGICVDRDGSLYICDYGNHVVRRLSPNGELSVVVGTLGNKDGDNPSVLSGKLLICCHLHSGPIGIAINSGWLYITEYNSHTIRKVELPLPFWTIKNHKQFPNKKKEIVKSLMMCFEKGGCVLSKLPKDILFIIISLSIRQ